MRQNGSHKPAARGFTVIEARCATKRWCCRRRAKRRAQSNDDVRAIDQRCLEALRALPDHARQRTPTTTRLCCATSPTRRLRTARRRRSGAVSGLRRSQSSVRAALTASGLRRRAQLRARVSRKGRQCRRLQRPRRGHRRCRARSDPGCRQRADPPCSRGPNTIYPRQHRDLAQHRRAAGAGHWLLRCRQNQASRDSHDIIAGLSLQHAGDQGGFEFGS